MLEDRLKLALTFDDILLVPAYSAFLPKDADLRTRLTRDLSLHIPFLSAAMDTVTEWRTAVTMAREGGLGILHKNMSPADQAKEVLRVKRAESGMIVDPITIPATIRLSQALDIMREHQISGLPVVEGDRKPVGILTSRDVRFEKNLDQPVSQLMTKDLVTAPPGVSQERARELLHQHRIEKLLVVDEDGKLVGLITIKDLLQAEKYPHAVKDSMGRLRCGAAVGVGPDRAERVAALVEAGLDVLVIDTAHGHSQGVIDAVRATKQEHPGLQVVAGNIATGAAAEALIDAGADALKVGIEAGSICTTRVVAGIGGAGLCHRRRRAGREAAWVPIIADGGIKFSGDVVKAIAVGADCVMMGSLFAGTDESPARLVLYRAVPTRATGMGSIGAMRVAAPTATARATSGTAAEARPRRHRGPRALPRSAQQRRAPMRRRPSRRHGLRAAAPSGRQTEAQFVRMSSQGLRESHVHDVVVTEEAELPHLKKTRNFTRRRRESGAVFVGAADAPCHPALPRRETPDA
ncbi:MAG: IMP dehydrogenase [Polyangiales bacterium]